VALLLSISCFSRTGGRPAGAVKAAWQSVLSPSRSLSCASHVGYRGSLSRTEQRERYDSNSARPPSSPGSPSSIIGARYRHYRIMLSAACTPTHRHESITKCLEYADGVTNAGDGARRFVDTLSAVFRPRRPPHHVSA